MRIERKGQIGEIQKEASSGISLVSGLRDEEEERVIKQEF